MHAAPVLSPREVFDRHRQAITARAWSDVAELYAEDVVVDLPFNLPEPLHLVGREQLRARFEAARNLGVELEMRNLVIHETQDPEVIVAEFDYDGRTTASGRTFSVANVSIMRVRKGQIVASRDYHNHAVMAQYLGDHPA